MPAGMLRAFQHFLLSLPLSLTGEQGSYTPVRERESERERERERQKEGVSERDKDI
jgi:hypothetical protein